MPVFRRVAGKFRIGKHLPGRRRRKPGHVKVRGKHARKQKMREHKNGQSEENAQERQE